MPRIERGGHRDILLDIQGTVNEIAVGASAARYKTFGPGVVDIDQIAEFGAVLTNPDGSIIQTGDITPGTHNVKRTRGGAATTLVNGAASSKEAGRIYTSYTFDDADWDTDDLFTFEFDGVKVDIGGNEYEYPRLYVWGRVSDQSSIDGKVTAIQGHVEDGDHGLAALEALISSIEGTGGSTGVGIAEELLENNHFDSDVTDWNDGGVSPETFEWSNAEYHNEAGSLKVTQTDTGDLVGRQTIGSLGIGTKVHTSYWVKSTVAGSASLRLEYGGGTIDLASESVLAGVWTKVERLGYELPVGATDWKLVMLFDPGSYPATAYFDDASFRLAEADLYNALTDIEMKVDDVQGTLDDPTDGLAAINANIGTVDGKVDTVDTVVDGIKAKTDALNFTGSDVKATLDGETVTVGTNNDKTGYSISGTKQTLDALNDVSAGTVNAQVDSALNTNVPTSPNARSLNAILEKNTGGGFNRATDSLEALRELLDDIHADIAALGGSGAAYELKCVRGDTALTDSWTTLTTFAPTDNMVIAQIFFYPYSMSSGQAKFRVGLKLKSGGSYRYLNSYGHYTDSDVNEMALLTSACTASQATRAVAGDVCNRYGIIIEALCELAGATGNVEWEVYYWEKAS